jgi:hypothetical protein
MRSAIAAMAHLLWNDSADERPKEQKRSQMQVASWGNNVRSGDEIDATGRPAMPFTHVRKSTDCRRSLS